MQAAPLSTEAPRPGPDTPKLRSSCDGCGTAKVKCDRGQPQCGRCKTLSLSCVYERSRKSGKPPRKRPGSNLDGTTEKRICTSSWTAESRDHHKTMESGEPQSANEPAHANFADLGTERLPFYYSIDDEQNQFELTSAFYPSMSLEDWPQLDSFGAGLDIPSTSAFEPISAVITDSNDRQPHSCPRESYEIFRDLICPSESLHAPESNSVTIWAQLDQVLNFNRNAIDRLTRILKCPCAKSGHRAMVHASSISRILIWYQQAAGWTGSSSWGSRPSALFDSSTSSPPPPSRTATDRNTTPSLVQATGFAVEHVPISIGTFNIEDQNMQAAFRNQLVLSELKKTVNLIDMFSSQDSGESPANGMASLSSHLGSWLRSEHSRIVRILRSRLSALNENLEF